MVIFNSKKKVWWQRENIIWQDSIYNRNIVGNDMPPKSSHNIHPTHSLEYVNPELASQWAPEKNGTLAPANVRPNSGKKVWWKCPRCENEWQSTVEKRHRRKDGCPYCSGHRASKEYCLESINPALAAQWHQEKNGKLTPRDVTPGSGKRVWWKCPNCSREWQTSISNRSTRGHGCSKCVDRSRALGSIAIEKPSLLLDWDYEKNAIKPEDCRARSNIKRWWKCSLCGYEWEASPDARYGGSGCPVCAKKKKNRYGASP